MTVLKSSFIFWHVFYPLVQFNVPLEFFTIRLPGKCVSGCSARFQLQSSGVSRCPGQSGPLCLRQNQQFVYLITFTFHKNIRSLRCLSAKFLIDKVVFQQNLESSALLKISNNSFFAFPVTFFLWKKILVDILFFDKSSY